MKRYLLNIIGVAMFLSLEACSDWLDIEPSDQVTDSELFKDGDGFRNALNGIYVSLSSPELYGRELSWGLTSVLSHTYADNDIAKSKAYKSALKFDYGETEIKAVIDAIWSKGYNAIANCNKLIGEAEAKDAATFREGQVEKNLIIGEAKALRAMMHFDILRMFAPSLASGKTGKYIPYFDTYPSKYESPLSTKEVLKRIEEDLLSAKDLVAEHDTIFNRKGMETPGSRLEGSDNANGGDFFGQRGIRLNYVAIEGLLARVYLYDNDLKKAEYYASSVIENFSNRRKWFYFTDSYDYTKSDNRKFIKLYEDILFAFYDRELLDKIDQFKAGNSGQSMSLKNNTSLFETDGDDYRKHLIFSLGSNGNVSMKWLNTHSTDQAVVAQYKLIPVIRLSEMYYILSEAKHLNNLSGALNDLKTVRKARGAKRDISKISSDKYYDELVAEYKKEFLAEGQMFFFFKRWNKSITSGTQVIEMEDKFVLPIPDSEIIY